MASSSFALHGSSSRPKSVTEPGKSMEEADIPPGWFHGGSYIRASQQIPTEDTQASMAISQTQRGRRRPSHVSSASGLTPLSKRRLVPRLILLCVTVGISVFLVKYASRCILLNRHSGRDASLLLSSQSPRRTPDSAGVGVRQVTGNTRRLAAAGGDRGDGKSPPDGASGYPRPDPFCSRGGVAQDAGPFATSGGTQEGTGEARRLPVVPPPGTSPRLWTTRHHGNYDLHASVTTGESAASFNVQDVLDGISSPSSDHEEAVVMRLLAEKVFEAASHLASVLPKLRRGSDSVRAASQTLTETYATLMRQAQIVENGETNIGDNTGTSPHHGQLSSSDVPAPGDGVAALGGKGSASEPGGIGGTLGPPYPEQLSLGKVRKPPSPSLPTPRSGWAPLQTISETDILAAELFDSSSRSGIERSIFGERHLGKDDYTTSHLWEALELSDLDRRDLGGWNPFSSQVADPRILFTATSSRDASGSASGTGEAGGGPRSHLTELYSTIASRLPRSTSAPPSRTQTSTTSAVKPVRSGPSPAAVGRRPLSVSRGLSPRGHPASRRTVSVGRSSVTQGRRGDRSVSKDRRPGTGLAITGGATGRSGTKMRVGPRQTTQHGTDRKGAASGTEKGSGDQSSTPKDGGEAGTSGHQRGGDGGPGGAGGSGRRPGGGGGDEKKPRRPPDGVAAGKSSGAKKDRKKEDDMPTSEQPAQGTIGGPSGQAASGTTKAAGKKGGVKGTDRKRKETPSSGGGGDKGGTEADRTKEGGGKSPSALTVDGVDQPSSAAGVTERSDSDGSTTEQRGAGGEEEEPRVSGPSETATHPPGEKTHGKAVRDKGKKKKATKAHGGGKGEAQRSPDSRVKAEPETSATQDSATDDKPGGGSDIDGKLHDMPEHAPPPAGVGLTEVHEESASTPDTEQTSEAAAGGSSISDTAAMMDAVRTGARPKTSQPASTKVRAKEKKKRAKDAAPLAAEPPSKPDDSDEDTTRGRTRHRARRGRSDSQLQSTRRDAAASSGGGDKGEKGDTEGTVPVPQGGFDSVARNLEAKVQGIWAKYKQDREGFDERPGMKTFLEAVVKDVAPQHDFGVPFVSLCEMVMTDLDAMCRLEALGKVAVNLKATVGRVPTSRRPDEGSDAGAAGGDDEAGRDVAVTDTTLASVIEMAEMKANDIRTRVIPLTRVMVLARYRLILENHLPETPLFTFPSDIAPPQAPTSAEGYSVEEVHLPSCASPVAALLHFVTQLTAWKKTILAVGRDLEEEWWIRPEDPDEATREHNRTVLAFEAASAAAVFSILKQKQVKWNLQELATVETNPQRKTAYEDASRILEKYIEEERQQKLNSFASYTVSLVGTAASRVKKKLGPWVSPPGNSHCPEIRALVETSDESPSDEARGGGSE
ncbi:UNVERIFIED_CONTAM: Toxoplasma gondii family E protein [Hammondia hammondi]|eukprot:XP_008885281.1 Toxoplasma gondii family E protein [Hammondia hammondi]